MRRLKKNCSVFWYANFARNESIVDSETGYKSGEKKPVYSNPVKGFENISPSRGESQIEQFGSYEDYSKVIVTYDIDYPMDENSILWVDTDPEIDSEGKATVPHDYIVTHVAKSLNVKAYAINKVKVS